VDDGAADDPGSDDGPTDDSTTDDGAADDGAADDGAGGGSGEDDGAETGAGGMMGTGTDDDAMPGTAEPRCSAEMTEASKTVVRDGITAVFINGNGAVIDDYWADPYIQHNPGATSGVDTFKGFFANVSPGFYSLTRLIGECDLVLIHGSYGSGGTFDMLRVDQDKMRMVEHWDAGMSGNDLLGGPTEVTDLELTEANRAVVDGFTDEVMIGGNADATSTYLAASVTEHGAGQFAERISSGDSYSTVHHQIAEGNFVFTLSEGVSGGNATGFWDLYRVDGGLIVEHWGAKLGVQAGASGEGIF
jgi:predicted SnoaL-like aldol condensation-catalyzing enzyme